VDGIRSVAAQWRNARGVRKAAVRLEAGKTTSTGKTTSIRHSEAAPPRPISRWAPPPARGLAQSGFNKSASAVPTAPVLPRALTETL
jgi:hypothetical protein